MYIVFIRLGKLPDEVCIPKKQRVPDNACINLHRARAYLMLFIISIAYRTWNQRAIVHVHGQRILHNLNIWLGVDVEI